MVKPQEVKKEGRSAMPEAKRAFGKLGTGSLQIEEIAKMGRKRYNHDEVAEKINSLPEADRRKAADDFLYEAVAAGNMDFTDADWIIRKIKLPKKDIDELHDTYVTAMRM